MRQRIGDKQGDFLTELDPRMKLLLVVLFTTTTYLSKNLLALIWCYILIVSFYLIRRLWKGAMKTALLFLAFVLLDCVMQFVSHEGTKATLRLILFFLQRTSIFFVMANWMSTKLRVSDFVSAMQNMHIPKGVIITLAVVFRYLPTVKEEFYYIKNTMKLRGIGLNARNILLHPIKSCEYAIVPLIIRSVTISDELAASAMTRGLDLVTKRTSYRKVKLCASDFFVTAVIIVAVTGGMLLNQYLEKGGI